MSKLQHGDDVINYDQRGHGPDIVWIAGGDQLGSDWHAWQTPAFEADFRCTTYDARGVGASVCTARPPWTMADLAADCAALIRAVCEPPVFLVSLSMGSSIAQELCLDHPELVRAAVVMGTCADHGGFIAEWEQAEIEFRRAGGTLPEAFAITHYAAFMYPSEVLGDEELWARVRPVVEAAYGGRKGADLAAQWESCVNYRSIDRLPHCQVPLHVIAFGQDMQTPPALGKVVAEMAPKGQYHFLEGLGHCSAFGHRPDIVNTCIADILRPYVERDGAV